VSDQSAPVSITLRTDEPTLTEVSFSAGYVNAQWAATAVPATSYEIDLLQDKRRRAAVAQAALWCGASVGIREADAGHPLIDARHDEADPPGLGSGDNRIDG
jgi:hypothetical protein